jgi:phosphoglucomutase
VTAKNIDSVLKKAEQGITQYLQKSRESGRLDEQLYKDALAATFPNLKKWLTDPHIDTISPLLKKAVISAISKGKWKDIVNAYRQSVRFGTGGIRGMMAFDKASIIKLKKEGIQTDIFKGPNTINDLVILLTSAGVARYGRAQQPKLEKIVIGYDSRIRVHDFAALVATLFLAYDYTVYFFDAPCPYPEVTFAIPNEAVKADVGVLISASHNDYRYNGYKLSCANGSQFDPEERDEMYNKYIKDSQTKDIRLCEYKDAGRDRLWFLGGDEPVQGFDYAGREDRIIDMHAKHRDHIKSFLVTADLAARQEKAKDPLHVGFCAFHGAGLIAVPRLLREVGFRDVKPVNGNKSRLGLNELNGLFPAFRSDPGKEQQPDPGDPRAAATAVEALREDYPRDHKAVDLLLGTDPDADRTGIIVRVPSEQKRIYDNRDFYLMPADDVWTLVLWYRLHREIKKYGRVRDARKKFVVLSHTTSDSITRVARKYGIGVLKSWVGFAALAAVTRDTWDGKARQFSHLVDGRDEQYTDVCHPFVCEASDMDNGQRSINIAAMEQSNGFSLLGGPPPDARSLGRGGHVRDKDGTFAALLVAEIAAWAKEQGSDLIGLLDRYVYLDRDIGLFATFYEPDPLDGEYPGIEGDRIKKNILRRALGFYQLALAGDLEIAGHRVISAAIYRTGKYDRIYPPSHDFVFPDEGIRFFFDEDKLQHLTIRPSGTGNSLRFHIQLHAEPTRKNLLQTKKEIRRDGRRIMNELRKMLRAPRE